MLMDMNEKTDTTPAIQLPVVYNPSEVIGIFADALAKRSAGVIHVRGVYRPGKGVQYGGSFYDFLKDEFSQRMLTIIVPSEIRTKLTEGNLVDLKGLVERRVNNDCSVQLQLAVTGMTMVQEQAFSDEELRRIEIRNGKAKAGFKNVDGILESAIFADRRPSVGLVYADSSITDADFNAGKEAAETQIDFHEYRVSFARPDAFVKVLLEADDNRHDCVCIVRGGGAGLEALDNLDVLECVAGMKTAVIAAVGHTKDKVFINEIADLEKGTPSLLGSYFQNLVESVLKKKADSTAALSRKIEAQFKQQIDTAKKQNEDLQKKIEDLTKASADARTLHDGQVKASQKQMEELQKQLADLTKANKDQSASFTTELGKMQGSISSLNQQNQSLNAKLARAEERNGALEKSLQEARQKKSGTGLVIAVVVLSILLIISLLLR